MVLVESSPMNIFNLIEYMFRPNNRSMYLPQLPRLLKRDLIQILKTEKVKLPFPIPNLSGLVADVSEAEDRRENPF